ncbi:MAG: hypothetical protein WKG01_08570 [Kofleriaceae bacterium]
MRRILVAVVGLAACASSSGEDREARALAALDLAAASARVRALVVDCAGFTRALGRMKYLAGRALLGLAADAVDAARPYCEHPLNAARGGLPAHQLARARLLDRPADALATLEVTSREPAIQLRRAELLDAQGRPAEALVALDLAGLRDDETQVLRRSLVIATHAVAGRHAELARVIADAPVQDRPGLAHRAIAHLPVVQLDALVASAGPELVVAIAERLERERGPAAALAARSRAAVQAPDDAELHDALARALIAAHRIDDALVAWARAAPLAPAQPSYRIAPVRALVLAGERDRARARARAVATAARQTRDAEAVLAASNAASAIDPARAVARARVALALAPGDGRYAFQLAGRLAEAGDPAAAAETYVELLVCGRHGRPWHRHELAGKLIALATDRASAQRVLAALDASRSCAVVEPSQLATYIQPARAKLAAM